MDKKATWGTAGVKNGLLRNLSVKLGTMAEDHEFRCAVQQLPAEQPELALLRFVVRGAQSEEDWMVRASDVVTDEDAIRSLVDRVNQVTANVAVVIMGEPIEGWSRTSAAGSARESSQAQG